MTSYQLSLLSKHWNGWSIQFLIIKDLLNRLNKSKNFSKFDMKSRFWQVQMNKNDRYKIAFTVPFGQSNWRVMSFDLKNVPWKFHKIMNDIFNSYSDYIILYIDDILIFSYNIDRHFKHIFVFVKTIKKNGLVVSSTKISLFQTSFRFLIIIFIKGLLLQ